MEAPARRRPVAPSLVALAVFTLLAIGHTWPLASNPAHLSRNDNGDTLLNTWVIAWVAHQLPRHPLHVFHALILHPPGPSGRRRAAPPPPPPSAPRLRRSDLPSAAADARLHGSDDRPGRHGDAD